MDFIEGIGLYPDGGNLIDMLGLVREEDAAPEAVRQGTVLVRVNHGGTWEADGHIPGVKDKAARLIYI